MSAQVERAELVGAARELGGLADLVAAGGRFSGQDDVDPAGARPRVGRSLVSWPALEILRAAHVSSTEQRIVAIA
jgi:hypothetical protein